MMDEAATGDDVPIEQLVRLLVPAYNLVPGDLVIRRGKVLILGLIVGCHRMHHTGPGVVQLDIVWSDPLSEFDDRFVSLHVHSDYEVLRLARAQEDGTRPRRSIAYTAARLSANRTADAV